MGFKRAIAKYPTKDTKLDSTLRDLVASINSIIDNSYTKDEVEGIIAQLSFVGGMPFEKDFLGNLMPRITTFLSPEVSFILDFKGRLTPASTNFLDENFELDINDNIIPRSA